MDDNRERIGTDEWPEFVTIRSRDLRVYPVEHEVVEWEAIFCSEDNYCESANGDADFKLAETHDALVGVTEELETAQQRVHELTEEVAYRDGQLQHVRAQNSLHEQELNMWNLLCRRLYLNVPEVKEIVDGLEFMAQAAGYPGDLRNPWEVIWDVVTALVAQDAPASTPTDT